MGYKIKSLKIDKGVLANYSMSGSRADYISPLGKMNIFVGANNSGKSRLLRGFLMTQKPVYYPADFNYLDIQKKAKEIKNKSLEIMNASTFVEIHPNGGSPLRASIEAIDPEAGFGEEPNLVGHLLQLHHNAQRVHEHGTSGHQSGRASSPVRFNHPQQVGSAIYSIFTHDYPEFEKDLSKLPKTPISHSKLYIPILRGMRPSISTKADFYHERTARDYFTDKDGNFIPQGLTIFSGLSIYDAIQQKLLGSLSERQLVGKYEKYLSETFFEGKSVTMIPRQGHDVLTIKIGKEVEKEIFNIGDGFQTLIAITYPIFEHAILRREENLLVCIEEPELLVHPGLQRTLMHELTTSKYYENMQFFVTTHSNHFLDLTLDYEDVSIFRLRKELGEAEEEEIVPKFLIENVSNKDKQTLEILGVKNSSVFLSNATIWVEGITDRMYLRNAFNQWQNKYAKGKRQFREDYHYSFIEYGGSNISHWDFVEETETSQMPVQSIVSNIFLIADSDDDGGTTLNAKKKEARLKAIKSKFGKNFCKLPVREVENLISPKVLKQVAEKLRATKGLDKELLQETYANKRMGEFISKFFGIEGFADKYGAIKNKRKFAEKVLVEAKSVEDLSPEMISICKKLYKFIEESNSI